MPEKPFAVSKQYHNKQPPFLLFIYTYNSMWMISLEEALDTHGIATHGKKGNNATNKNVIILLILILHTSRGGGYINL